MDEILSKGFEIEMANDNLRQAKAAKNDEFYTQYEDIATELKHYSTFLRGKIVFCNCDDPAWSNFWKYLHNNFAVLGLKKLISTHYEPDGSPSYKIEYEGGDDLNTDVGTITPLEGNGDFRSKECMEILKECDVVITNPPFSLFREYMKVLVESDKKFIIIGTMNSLHYKEIFPLIEENKVWTGFSFNKTMEFVMPDDYELKGKAYIDADGKKHGFVPGILWYTNIDIKKRHELFFKPEDAHSYYEGNEDKYPRYINFDAIEVNSTSRIPIDYTGMMGVPDNFLERYNPQEFEIIGLGDSNLGLSIGMSANLTSEQKAALKKENPSFRQGNPIFRDSSGKLKKPFSRIIIRNRRPIAKKDDI